MFNQLGSLVGKKKFFTQCFPILTLFTHANVHNSWKQLLNVNHAGGSDFDRKLQIENFQKNSSIISNYQQTLKANECILSIFFVVDETWAWSVIKLLSRLFKNSNIWLGDGLVLKAIKILTFIVRYFYRFFPINDDVIIRLHTFTFVSGFRCFFYIDGLNIKPKIRHTI